VQVSIVVDKNFPTISSVPELEFNLSWSWSWSCV